MTRKKKKSRFKGIVSRNAAKQARGSQYVHLNLPKGIGVFREEPKTRVNLDIIPYIVNRGKSPGSRRRIRNRYPGEPLVSASLFLTP